jgi:cell division septal protein FtsQ
MIRWLRRCKTDDLRPTYAERQAALERARERLRRQQSAESRRRAWLRIGLPGCAALAFLAGLALADRVAARGAAARPELFVVQRLEIEGAQRLDSAALARAVLPEGAPEPMELAEIASRLEAHPWIAHVAVARVAPSAVVARIEEQEPAALACAVGEARLLVNAQGVAFAEAEGAEWDSLPRLVVASPPPRNRRDPLLAQGIALAHAVSEAGFTGIELSLDGEDPNALPALRVQGVDGRIVLGAGDPAQKLAKLVRLLAHDRSSDSEGQALRAMPHDSEGQALRAMPHDSEGQALRAMQAREIDLRFEEQIVLRPVVAPELGNDGPTSGADAPGSATGVPAPRRATGDRPGESRRSPEQRKG